MNGVSMTRLQEIFLEPLYPLEPQLTYSVVQFTQNGTRCQNTKAQSNGTHNPPFACSSVAGILLWRAHNYPICRNNLTGYIIFCKISIYLFLLSLSNDSEGHMDFNIGFYMFFDDE